MPIGIWQKQNFSMEKPTFKQDLKEFPKMGTKINKQFTVQKEIKHSNRQEKQ